VNPIPSNPTVCKLSSATGTMLHRLARLVIEAECTTCGRICDENGEGISTVRLALAHSGATGHVVILNGTTDLPCTE
jgi:hypothetical protein